MPTRNSAIGAGVRDLLAAQHESTPFGVVGEWIVPTQSEPSPPAPEPLIIEPPDWSQELSDISSVEDAAAPVVSAFESMMSREAEIGALDESPPFGPPLAYAPLQRPEIPEADWRA